MSNSEIDTISPEEVRQRLESGEALHVIDVREVEEVSQGMIPGARHIPLGDLPDRHREIGRNAETIFVCRSGNRSGKACDYLKQLGYKGLKNMTGGMLAYGEP